MSVRRIFSTVLLLAVTLALAVSQTGGAGSGRAIEASAAPVHFHLFVKVDAQKQGILKGDSLQKGRTDWMVAHAFDYGLVAPRDAASGLPSGKRMHKPIVITKEWGASSPQLLAAASSNENLKTVTLEFVDTDKSGAERVHFSIKLTNASLFEVKQHFNGDVLTEDLSFTFQKIEWEDKVAKTVFMDSWVGAAT
jgi:type VI secretion system secreted protein Hcp